MTIARISGRSHLIKEKEAKNYNSLCGGDSKIATQAMPPSPKLAEWRPKSAGLPSPHHVSNPQRPARDPRRPARTCQGVTWPVWWGGGGEKRDFFKYSSIKGYFKRPILQNRSAKLAPTLLQCQSLPTSFPRAVRSEYPAYIVFAPL